MPRPMSDVYTKEGTAWEGERTLDVYCKDTGFLGTLIDDKGYRLRMQIVSVTDHLTEPRGVEDYHYLKLESVKCPYALMWGDRILGGVTTEEGAQRMLDYLKSNAE